MGEYLTNLSVGTDYFVTSPAAFKYNCLAWAVGMNWAWYDPEPRCAGYYWMPGQSREWTLTNLKKVLSVHGYSTETTDASFQTGVTKLAIYVDKDQVPSHFAKQTAHQMWASKLGKLNDIEHPSLESLIPLYGQVAIILQHRSL